MRGITNAPQGGGSSGSSGWTLRTDNNNWSDLFDVDGATLTAKKDIYIFRESGTDKGSGSGFIPKGAESIYGFTIRFHDYSGSLTDYVGIHIAYNNITGSSLTVFGYVESYTTDGSTVTKTRTVSNSTIQKGNLIIYTKD